MVHRIRAIDHRLLMLRFTLLMLILRISESHSTIVSSNLSRLIVKESQLPAEPPDLDHQPVLPLLAPAPLMPFTNVSVPKLSGKCPLNFSNVESIITTTAIDCWGSLAPYLANVVCCPQLDATINILIAQSSFSSGHLVINNAHAKYCLSDITQLLEAQGAYNQLVELCLINPANLTQGSCPFVDLKEIENTLNNSTVFESCKTIDPVKECSHRDCEKAITDVAMSMVSKNYSMPGVIDDCKKIVVRWLASKLKPYDASKVLRGISSCEINQGCPLVFPDMKNISKECGNTINNQTTCCNALDHYITQLQNQSFVTNLQAINCASSFASSLQKANVSVNVYDMCHIKLKDFSLQVGSEDSGCLFPSLPFDVTYDQSSGIDFKCDLNDNVAAPWLLSPHSSSNTSTELPALPKAASDQNALWVNVNLFISTLLMLTLFI